MDSIAKKLIIYFGISLLVFTIIISSIYVVIFRVNILKKSRQDLENKAIMISDTLSAYMASDLLGKNKMGMGGFGAYLNFLDEIAMSEVWLVDKDLSMITMANRMNGINYSELPPDGEKVIRQALAGKISFSESFSGLIGEQTISVGAPIKDDKGEILGVVLLHSSVEGIESVVVDSLKVLAISIGIALILAIATSMILSLRFVKPIKKIEYAARKLAEGEFTINTGVSQSDEIGKLATAVDILSERLYLASKESQRLENIKNDFYTNISHELRTPVTVLRGSLEAICDGVVTDENQKKEYLNQMLNESINLQRLVNDLLDLTRLQNIDFKMDMQHLNLCNVIQDAINSVRNLAYKKNITILYENKIKEFSLIGDYGRLRQMLMIVLDNAIKFSANSGNIEIEFLIVQNMGYLSVKDYGKGISQEDIPHIFERFYKNNDHDNKMGTGIGLAIAKEIALRHKAKISVESIPNNETTFLFSFEQIEIKSAL